MTTSTRVGSGRKKLMWVICKYNFTDYLINSKTKSLQVYGNMESVDMTVWLYHFLEIGLYNLSEKHYQTELSKKTGEERKRFSRVAYTFKRDFLLGAVKGFNDQLQEQRSQQNSKVNEMILYNKNALNEYLKLTFGPIRLVSSRPLPRPGAGWSAGYEAGKSFKINKPLNNDSSQTKQLK
jgi:hypothetical protein